MSAGRRARSAPLKAEEAEELAIEDHDQGAGGRRRRRTPRASGSRNSPARRLLGRGAKEAGQRDPRRQHIAERARTRRPGRASDPAAPPETVESATESECST